jgi:hypothetical protein
LSAKRLQFFGAKLDWCSFALDRSSEIVLSALLRLNLGPQSRLNVLAGEFERQHHKIELLNSFKLCGLLLGKNEKPQA